MIGAAEPSFPFNPCLRVARTVHAEKTEVATKDA
jgi:hypothetical protein